MLRNLVIPPLPLLLTGRKVMFTKFHASEPLILGQLEFRWELIRFIFAAISKSVRAFMIFKLEALTHFALAVFPGLMLSVFLAALDQVRRKYQNGGLSAHAHLS